MQLRTRLGAPRLPPAAAGPLAAALCAEPDLFARLAALRAAVATAGDSLQARLRLQAELAHRAPLLALALAPGALPPGAVPAPRDLPGLAAALAHLGRYRAFFAEIRARLEYPRRALDDRTASLLRDVIAEHAALVAPASVTGLATAVVDDDGLTVADALRIDSRAVVRWLARGAGDGGAAAEAATGPPSGFGRPPERAAGSPPGLAPPATAPVALFVATIGPALDAEVARLGRTAPTRALLLHAYGAAAADLLAADLALALEDDLPGAGRVRRYHAGYGDWSPRAQAPLLGLLEAEARLGVRLTPAGLMLPEKSVSGLAARALCAPPTG